MKIVTVRALAGPNIWGHFPILEAVIDVGTGDNGRPGNVIGSQRLADLFPTVNTYLTQTDPVAVVDLPPEATILAQRLQRIACELQCMAGTKASFGRVQATHRQGVYRLAIEYDDEGLGRACLASALAICVAAAGERDFDVPGEIVRLRELGHDSRLGPSTRSIVEAAKKRGIPAIRLSEGNLVQFGYGARQKRILAAETDGTSAIAETIAQDKELTRSLLRRMGVPVPVGRSTTSASEAWQVAREIGLPVVVKPRYGSQGRGVATNLSTRRQVVAACEAASSEGTIVVEQFIRGADYRLLVVGDRMVAVARRDPPAVYGDGRRTVNELVEAANTDPLRADGHGAPLSKLAIDAVSDQVLAEQGLSPESVPPAGERVLIRRNGNLSTGGTATDVTDDVHPDVARRAVEAARIVGLDIAGVDILAQDIRRPLEEQRGAVIEVNACPGLRMHLHPSHGRPRPVGESIVDLMFSAGETGRIPIAAVTGGNPTTGHLLAHLLKQTGTAVGLATGAKRFVDGRPLECDASGPAASADPLLLHPLVEAAVFQTEPAAILRHGLPFDLCDVAIAAELTTRGAAAVSETDDELVGAGVCLLGAVAPRGVAVLNADDPLATAVAERYAGKLLYFSRDEHHPLLFSHRLQGGRAVFVRDHCVVVAVGMQDTVVAQLDGLRFTYQGLIASRVESALAAVAAAWALGLSWERLRAGLASFPANDDRLHAPIGRRDAFASVA